jgi:steroid delta-isomerase
VTATPESIQATLDAYVAGYRSNDKDAVVALYADDCEWTDPVGTPTHHGKDGVAKFWDDARALADSIVLEPVQVHICGNEAAMVFEIHASVGGNTMIMDAVDVFVFDDDGKIKVGKAYWDMAKARMG